ncbi:MAG: AAA family ATPase [Longimicrobiales bacterium]|nr:AAA family ATPase [Longimicrobiales bacterium]
MINRDIELHALANFLAEPAPSRLLVHGDAGVGKSTLVRTALRRTASVWLTGSGLPPELAGPAAAAALREQLRGHPGVEEGLHALDTPPEGGARGSAPPGTRSRATPGPWRDAVRWLRLLLRLPDPPVLVLDGADPLLDDRRLRAALDALWGEARARGRPLRMIATLRGAGTPEAWGAEGESAGPPAQRLAVTPLRLREAARTVPRWSARECVDLYALVGGLPAFWSWVDPGTSPARNLARLLVAPEGIGRDLPGALLPADVLGNRRSMALVTALAGGARTWGELRHGARVFRASAELGPYLTRLVSAGVVLAERSLDAAPGSRRRRYRLAHPLLACWHGAVVPHLGALQRGDDPLGLLRGTMAPALRALTARALPPLVGEFLLHHGEEALPARAREAGGAWGEGYDLPLAATLESGAAVYGRVAWDGPPPGPDALDAVVGEIRRVRYGFDREARIPILVTASPPGPELIRRAARAPAVVLGPEQLLGRG